MEDKKAVIFNCGKELFSAKGFKDTNVSDITKLAGVAVGTFYNYYSSKENLFMEIFLEENVKLKKHIMESINLKGEPLNVIKELTALNLQGMYANPILKEWYNRDVFGKIEQHYREVKGIERFDFIYDSFLEIVKKWQMEGKMRSDIDPGLIMAFFSALINIDMHKEEIGIQYFPEIMDYLGDFIIKGITECPKN